MMMMMESRDSDEGRHNGMHGDMYHQHHYHYHQHHHHHHYHYHHHSHLSGGRGDSEVEVMDQSTAGAASHCGRIVPRHGDSIGDDM